MGTCHSVFAAHTHGFPLQLSFFFQKRNLMMTKIPHLSLTHFCQWSAWSCKLALYINKITFYPAAVTTLCSYFGMWVVFSDTPPWLDLDNKGQLLWTRTKTLLVGNLPGCSRLAYSSKLCWPVWDMSVLSPYKHQDYPKESAPMEVHQSSQPL